MNTRKGGTGRMHSNTIKCNQAGYLTVQIRDRIGKNLYINSWDGVTESGQLQSEI